MHEKLTEGPLATQKVHGRSLSLTESRETVLRPHGKLAKGHAATRKVVEGPPATLKVNGESRRHTESQLKLTEGPAAAKNVDRNAHGRVES